MKQQPIDADKALVRLENLCARSEYSEVEVRKRLRKWGVGAVESDRIVERLRRGRFIDDNRFAAGYVRDKYRYSRWGRLKIRAGLRMAGISSSTAELALEEIDPEEYLEGLIHILKRKNSTLSPENEDYDRSVRLMRFAAARGFEPSLIRKALTALDS